MKSIILKKAAVVTAAILVTGLIGCGNTKENEKSAESQETATPEIEEPETIDEPEEIEEPKTVEPVQEITGNPENYEYQIYNMNEQAILGINIPDGWENDTAELNISYNIDGKEYRYKVALKSMEEIEDTYSYGTTYESLYITTSEHYTPIIIDSQNNTISLDEDAFTMGGYLNVINRSIDQKDTIDTSFGTVDIYYYELERSAADIAYNTKSKGEYGILKIDSNYIIIGYSYDYVYEQGEEGYQSRLLNILPQMLETK